MTLQTPFHPYPDNCIEPETRHHADDVSREFAYRGKRKSQDDETRNAQRGGDEALPQAEGLKPKDEIMPTTPDRKVTGALTRADIEAAGVKPDDIEPEWIDQMVKRLFRELNRQLACIESTKPDDGDAKKASVRASNIRSLGAIERTLERLAKMEQERIAKRQTKTAGKNEHLRV